MDSSNVEKNSSASILFYLKFLVAILFNVATYWKDAAHSVANDSSSSSGKIIKMGSLYVSKSAESGL